MVQRYYLDLTDGRTIIRDAVGVEADGPTELAEEASHALAELRHEGDLAGVEATWRMLVRDAHGRLVRVLPIAPGPDDAGSASPSRG